MRYSAAVRWSIALVALAGLTAAPVPAADAPRLVDIDIDLQLDLEHGIFVQTVRLTVEGRGLDEVEFAIHENLSVETSSADHGIVEHRKAGSRLLAFVDPPIDGRRSLTFRITGRPKGRSFIGADGFVLDPADAWYPATAHTWATARVSVQAPEDWIVVGPAAGEGPPERRRSFRVERPLRSIALAGAPGLQSTEAEALRTPLRFVGPAGADDAWAAGWFADPLAFFGSRLAPFPFRDLTVARIPGLAERVEGTGTILLGERTTLVDESDAADLIAGQWWGQWIAGRGRWIEALAAWQASDYATARTRPLAGELARLRQDYFNLPRGMDVALGDADRRSPAAVVRGRGSRAPEMLRRIVGDRRFEAALHELVEFGGLGPVDLARFRESVVRHAGKEALRPFREWFESAGVPELESELRTFPASRGGWRVDVTIRQLRGPYQLPLELVFHGEGRSHRERVELTEERLAVFYVLPFRPGRLELDPGGKLYRWPDRQGSGPRR